MGSDKARAARMSDFSVIKPFMNLNLWLSES